MGNGIGVGVFEIKPALLQKARVTRKHKELNIQLEKRPGSFSLFISRDGFTC